MISQFKEQRAQKKFKQEKMERSKSRKSIRIHTILTFSVLQSCGSMAIFFNFLYKILFLSDIKATYKIQKYRVLPGVKTRLCELIFCQKYLFVNRKYNK